MFWTLIPLRLQDLAPRQPDLKERVRGPPMKAALKDGQPTKAAEGFCRKNGVAVESLEVEGDYVWATVESKGQPAAAVLAEVSCARTWLCWLSWSTLGSLCSARRSPAQPPDQAHSHI